MTMPLKLCFVSFGNALIVKKTRSAGRRRPTGYFNALIVIFHHTMELEFYTFLNIISKYVKSQNYYENLLGKVC
jgi:hypothetical protein